MRTWRISSTIQRAPLVRLLGDGGPFPGTQFLSLCGAVLLLGVFVGAVVEKLRVDFHEQLHGVVHHAMNRSGDMLELGTIFMLQRSTHLFQ